MHTAGGISIRFPRVTKERSDKTWVTATSLEELRILYDESKNNIDIEMKPESDEEMDVPSASDNTNMKRLSESPVKTSSPKKAKENKDKVELNIFKI